MPFGPIASIAITHLSVAAGLVIKNGRWNEVRQTHSPGALIQGRRHALAFLRHALIFRELLDEAQARS